MESKYIVMFAFTSSYCVSWYFNWLKDCEVTDKYLYAFNVFALWDVTIALKKCFLLYFITKEPDHHSWSLAELDTNITLCSI